MIEWIKGMSNYEMVAVIISVVALISTGINIFFYVRLTKEYNGLVKEQNKISQGEAETSIRALIMEARQEVDSISEKIAFNPDKRNKNQEDILNKILESALEDLRNAYEEACSRYLDGKADKERFKRMYFVEIKNLVEDANQKDKFVKPQTHYKAIVKVYDEWNDLEK